MRYGELGRSALQEAEGSHQGRLTPPVINVPFGCLPFFQDLRLLNCWNLGTKSVSNPFTLLSDLCSGRSDPSRNADMGTKTPQSLLAVPLLLSVDVKLRSLTFFHLKKSSVTVLSPPLTDLHP